MSMAPASTMPWMEFAADISGVCSIDGTLLMTSKPTSRLSTKIVISARSAGLIGFTSGGSCGIEKFRHSGMDHLARMGDDDTGLDLVAGVDRQLAIVDHVGEQRRDIAGISRGRGGGHGGGQVPGSDDGDAVVGDDGLLGF